MNIKLQTNEQLSATVANGLAGVFINGVSLSASLSGKADVSAIPINVSQLSNDSGYLTAHQSLSNYYTKSETSSATEISTAFANAGGGSDQLSTKLDSSASWPAWVADRFYDYKQVVSHNGKLWKANGPAPEFEPGSP